MIDKTCFKTVLGPFSDRDIFKKPWGQVPLFILAQNFLFLSLQLLGIPVLSVVFSSAVQDLLLNVHDESERDVGAGPLSLPWKWNAAFLDGVYEEPLT